MILPFFCSTMTSESVSSNFHIPTPTNNMFEYNYVFAVPIVISNLELRFYHRVLPQSECHRTRECLDAFLHTLSNRVTTSNTLTNVTSQVPTHTSDLMLPPHAKPRHVPIRMHLPALCATLNPQPPTLFRVGGGQPGVGGPTRFEGVRPGLGG